MPLIKTVFDVVDNYVAQAGDATGGCFRAYVEGSRWIGWTTAWPDLLGNNRLRLVRGMVEVDDSSIVCKQGVHLKLGVLVRRGTGIVFLDPKGGSCQGYGQRLTFGPAESEWGIAGSFPAGTIAAGDICITSLTLQRYLP